MGQQIGSHMISDSAVPMVPVTNDSFGATQGSPIASAGSDAQKMAIQIIQQASQGASQNPIVNRPQVILPQPKVPTKLPTDTPPTGMVNATTKAGQRRNDMQSLISSVGNIVRAGINKKNQTQERDLMHDLAIIQAASSNPDDPHNKMILDKMMNDPKVVKRLQKALGYNPLSGEEPPPEAKTLMKFGAQQKIKQQGQQGGGGQPTGQSGQAMTNLMSRMPNVQQINPVVAMQAELIKAGILPKNDLSPKALLEYVQEAMKDDTKREEIKARAESTNNQTLMRLYDTLIRAQASMERGRERDTSQEKQTKMKVEAYKYGADKRFAAAESKAMQTDKTFRNFKIASDAYDQDIRRLEEQLSTALKQKSTGVQEKGVNLDEKITTLKQEIEQKKSIKGSLEQQMKQRLDVPPPEGGVDQLLQDDSPKEEDMKMGDYVFPSQQQ